MEPDDIVSWAGGHGITLKKLDATIPVTFLVDPTSLLKACDLFHQDPLHYFDQLSCVTGVDNGPEAGTLEVIYHLYSIPFNRSIALKVSVGRGEAVVDSVCAIWKSANWLEREVFDMYGIQFSNHPDLRRILMPADWEGNPLRKDYSQQELYREIKVSY